MNACSQFSVYNFVTSSHFSKVSVLTVRATDFSCCYVSTPSLVKLSDGADFLGLDPGIRQSNSFAPTNQIVSVHTWLDVAGLSRPAISSVISLKIMGLQL